MRLFPLRSILPGVKTAPNILLLAGSAEARLIAQAVQARGLNLHALVSEPPRGPDPMPVAFEMMDFRDTADLLPRLAGFDAVVDASHGFDAQMTRIGHAAAQQAGLPFVTLRRKRWSLEESPLWSGAPDVRAAMALIAPHEQVFSAAGWASLPDCAGFRGTRLFLRQTTPHDRNPPYPFVQLVFGQAPFTAASETALFQDIRIDVLLCRNLGGIPSRPKLDAALALGLRVILIDPPAVPEGVETLSDVAQVLAWVDAL